MSETKVTDPAIPSITKDPRRAKQFATKKDAVAGCAVIGWPSSDAYPIEVMGFKLWAIMDHHANMLTPTGFGRLQVARAEGGAS